MTKTYELTKEQAEKYDHINGVYDYINNELDERTALTLYAYGIKYAHFIKDDKTGTARIIIELWDSCD